MKDTKTPPRSEPLPKTTADNAIVPPASDRYLEGYVNGVYDAICVSALVALAMMAIYWYGISKSA